jgi:hypothetical protein
VTRRKEVELKAEISTATSVNADVVVKHSMSPSHFRAAAFFAERSAGLEDELRGTDLRDEASKSQHRAYIVAAVASAVMGLEACINEIYLDACDRSQRNLAGLNEQTMALLAEWWPEVEPRPILLKYQHALLLAGKPAMLKGENPYQDADNLICLRNALTHYKPEWDDSLHVHAGLRARLEGKFAANPLSSAAALWFPHQCLGGGCARWATPTAETFVSEFCRRLGIATRIRSTPQP